MRTWGGWWRASMAALVLTGAVGALPSPAGAVEGDLTFDGEAGALDASASAGATVAAEAARHGTGGLAISATAEKGFVRWNPDRLPQGHTHASARLWVRVLSRGAGESVDLFTIQNARRTENFDLFVNGVTGNLQWDLYRADTDWLEPALELGRWYLVEVQVDFGGEQYTASVRIDGVEQGTIASSYPATTVRSVWVGAEMAKTHAQHYDDLAVRVGDAPMGWSVTTPPTVDLAVPADGATYGRGESVAASYTCSGPELAVADCAGTVDHEAQLDTSTLGEHELTVTATDVAGHTTTVTHHYTVEDRTAPTIELRRPTDGAVVGRGEIVEVDFACDDDAGGSGVASCTGTAPSGGWLDTSVLGPHEFTATATDAAGNTTSATHSYTVVDRTSPRVDLRAPASGAVYARGALVEADYACFDEVGGSGLRPHGSCVGEVGIGAPIDTWTLGERSFTVTATDAAGNVSWTTHDYTVVDNQPDNQIAEVGTTRFRGDDVYGGPAAQTRWARVRRGRAVTFRVRVENDTGAVDRFQVRGGRNDRRWRVTYRSGDRDVSRAVKAGRYEVGPLAPGEFRVVRVVVRPTRFARPGHRRAVALTTSALGPGNGRDVVRAIVRRR